MAKIALSAEFQGFSWKSRPLTNIFGALENGHSIRRQSIPPLSAGRILGPEMAAPILWAPRISAFFLQENLHVHKIPRFGGGGGIFGLGGQCRFYFYGRRDFSDIYNSLSACFLGKRQNWAHSNKNTAATDLSHSFSRKPCFIPGSLGQGQVGKGGGQIRQQLTKNGPEDSQRRWDKQRRIVIELFSSLKTVTSLN